MSSPELAAITSDSERIMWNRANPSFLPTFPQAELRSEAVEETQINLEAALETDTESPPSEPTSGQAPPPAVNTSISSPMINTELKVATGEMVIQEAKCILVEQAGPSMQKAAGNALSDAFFGRFEETNTGLRDASYYFV